MRISLRSSGSFKRTENFLNRMSKADFIKKTLESAGKQGVAALEKATPIDSGESRTSWGYESVVSRGSVSIYWTNTHADGGAPVVILLQYGHGTGTGGYVQGRDFINPAMRPIFNKIADDVWKAVTSA